MSKNPLVSVIMNCYNGERYLKESVLSVINQSYKNWELIFWDNISDDNSKKIIENFSDKRIKYFYSKKFTGLYEARNLAIEKARGDYISFLDTDDFWQKDKLIKQVNFFEKNDGFEAVYSNYYVLNEAKNKKYVQHNVSLPSGSITQRLLDYYSVGILTTFLKRGVFEKYKFNKNYSVIGDFDFFINLSQRSKIGSINENLAFYRIHESNFSIKNLDLYIKELENWIKDNDENISNKGFSLKKQKILLKKLKVKFFLKNFLRF